MKIAVDAMGGDHGPAVVVEGAVAAVREFGLSVILVGDRAAIETEVRRLGAQSLGLEIRHASEIVGMAESPSMALRRKRDSSLRIAAELVRDGKAAAFISAGNTGAAMAISMFVIGVLRGIDRPAIAAVLPTLRGFSVLLGTGGMTGDVVMKTSEVGGELVGAMNTEELTRDPRSKVGAALSVTAFARFKKRVDYTEMGGAPLLGIDGAAVLCHGASPVKAIKN